MSEKETKRVLILADFCCATGFAMVAQNVVAQLLKDKDVVYQIDIVGINYHGMPNEWQGVYPRVRVFPAMLISSNDLFGRTGFLSMLSAGVYDLAWILQDTFNVEPIMEKIMELRKSLAVNNKKLFRLIFYFPIDAKPKENWIKKSVSLADVPVVYTQYGYDECIAVDPQLESKLKIIPHGVDTAIFHPIDQKDIDEFRGHYFLDRTKDKFLVTNVNRNQPRKDIARTMQIFRLFKNQCPDAVLYLHMNKYDVAYNLDEVARNYELIPNEDYICPANFQEHDGLPLEAVNAIYNASQVVMTTSLGEGWGLSMTEAMACKTPVIAPNHTSLTEILEYRGTLVSAGKRNSDWVVLQADNERMRPIVDVAEYVDKLVWIHNNYKEAKALAEKAYEYVTKNWTWDIIGEEWRQTFKNALIIEPEKKMGRNDPCYCLSGRKFKNCHGK